jgi:hypothetical protein
MNRLAALAVTFVLFCCPATFGQDAMQYGARHLQVLAEDQKVRVLRYTPKKGDRTPIHSHPATVAARVRSRTPQLRAWCEPPPHDNLAEWIRLASRRATLYKAAAARQV